MIPYYHLESRKIRFFSLLVGVWVEEMGWLGSLVFKARLTRYPFCSWMERVGYSSGLTEFVYRGGIQ